MGQTQRHLTLFVTGNAPRSQRARSNLADTIGALGCIQEIAVQEVDLLYDPTPALDNGIFAAPALMIGEAAQGGHVLYGDLSEAGKLWRLLVSRVDKAKPKGFKA